MDNNDYRTQLIVKSYKYAQTNHTEFKECEEWSLHATPGDVKLFFLDEIILSVINKETYLSPTITTKNKVPNYVQNWLNI